MYGLHNLPNLFEVHVALFYMYLAGNLKVWNFVGGYLELESSHGCLRVIMHSVEEALKYALGIAKLRSMLNINIKVWKEEFVSTFVCGGVAG